jgi:hypothetical protein
MSPWRLKIPRKCNIKKYSAVIRDQSTFIPIACVCVRVCVCVCVRARAHVCIYVYVYIYF